MVNMVRLFDAIYEEKINLYSFDVFDTTLTRLVLSPEHIYTVMEEKIRNIPEYPSYLRCNFLFLRRDAEKVAYRLSKDREEITLDDIYCYLREEHNLSERQKDQLVELEIETERKLSYGIEETIAAISELKKRGKKVVLISNTVHAGSTLQKLLRNVSTDLSDIPVYASSDYGVTKNTGKLFEVVRERERE